MATLNDLARDLGKGLDASYRYSLVAERDGNTYSYEVPFQKVVKMVEGVEPTPDLRLEKRRTLSALRIRAHRTQNSRTLDTAGQGEEILTVKGTGKQVGEYTWIQVAGWRDKVYDEAYAAEEYLLPLARSKLVGLHLAGGPVNFDFMGMIRYLVEKGRPLAGVTLVNHPELVDPILKVSPFTKIVQRDWFHPDGDPHKVGWPKGYQWFMRRWGAQTRGMSELAAHTVFHSFVNEWLLDANTKPDDVKRLTEFYVDLVEACAAKGARCTIGDISPGNLEPAHFEIFRPALKIAEEKGMALNYHMYTSEGNPDSFVKDEKFFSLRWVKWVKDYPDLQVIGGESGRYHGPRFRNWQDTIRLMNEHQIQLLPYRSQVVCTNWWTIAPTPDWAPDDCTSALGKVIEWLVA